MSGAGGHGRPAPTTAEGGLGDWNWWAPAPLRRFHARFGLREA